MSSETKPVVIKKYANRRLYHTGSSTYVTLEDLAAMVRTGEDFVVFDAKTGEDITRSVLTQIIFEEENKQGQHLLPVTFLRQLIRFYGDSMQSLVPRYLEFSIDNLTRDQQKLREAMNQTFGPAAAFQAMEEQVRANMVMFSEALRLFTPFTGAAGGAPHSTANGAANGTAEPAPTPAPSTDDLTELKRQVSEMQARLDRLGKE
jgi:polyhydroxyalkanoate synthesis repressor PhaR